MKQQNAKQFASAVTWATEYACFDQSFFPLYFCVLCGPLRLCVENSGILNAKTQSTAKHAKRTRKACKQLSGEIKPGRYLRLNQAAKLLATVHRIRRIKPKFALYIVDAHLRIGHRAGDHVDLYTLTG